MRKLSSSLNSCSPPVKEKVSLLVVALSITILVQLAKVAKSESAGVTSKNNYNNNSISSYNKSSVSSGGGGSSSSSSNTKVLTTTTTTTTTNYKQRDGK